MEEPEPVAPTYRHAERKTEFEPAFGEIDNIDLISDHIERHIGPIQMVYHELVSDLVHIDVHMVAPTAERNCYTLVTSGMSDRPMTTPERFNHLRFAELVISLPPDWSMDTSTWEDERNYWPVRVLKYLARFPHLYQTWLGYGHTIHNGNPPEPYAENTAMKAALLLPSITLPAEFSEIKVSPNRIIRFYAVMPLHEDELALKLSEGSEALLDGFEEKGVTDILDPSRPSVLA